MSFLFAELPAKNYEMTNTQLLIWQRSAIFECECDNLINQHIEADARTNRYRSRGNRRHINQSAIDAAINTHGLQLTSTESNHHHRRQSLPLLYSPPAAVEEQNNVFAVVLDGAYAAAARSIGINLPDLDP